MLDLRVADTLSPSDFEFFVRDVLAAAGWTNLEVTTPNREYRHGGRSANGARRSGEPVALRFLPGTGRSSEAVAVHIAPAGAEVFTVPLDQRADVEAVGQALQTVMVIGHDLRAGLATLAQQFGIRLPDVRDTLIASKLLDGGLDRPNRYHELPDVLTRYLTVDLGPHGKAPEDPSAQTALLHRLYEVTGQLIRHFGLERTAVLEAHVLPVVVDMSAPGVGIDRSAWTAFMDARVAQEADRRRELQAHLAVENLQDDGQVLAALQRRGLPVVKTNRIALAPFVASDPVLRDLVAWRSLNGFLQGPGRGVADALDRSPDGRVRANLDPLGAATGRFGCSRPNLLGLPKRADPEVRRCVVPAAGYVFVVADYSAIELRVIADRVVDPVLMAVFREGGDPHRLTASAFLGKPPDQVTAAERNSAKPANFGLAFGMSTDTLIEYALDKFGVVLSPADAARYRDAFFATYTGIASWHECIKAEMPDEVRTASGRIRRLWRSRHGLCERLNSPIQGTAADGMKRTLIILHDRLARYGARLVLCVHDEVLVEAPIEVANEVAELVRTVMIEGMEEFVPNVPIEVDASIRRTWAEEQAAR